LLFLLIPSSVISTLLLDCLSNLTVLANLKSHKADGIACPRIDGYNNHINFEKGKGFLVNSVTALNSSTQESLPKNPMVIVSKYELVEKTENGVFCTEFGENTLPTLQQS
jgi:hypothetical protein